MKEKKNLKIIEKTVAEILKLLDIARFDLILVEEEEIIMVTIKTEEPELLIGRDGENLGALQLIARLSVYKKSGEWQKIILNVNDWREKREEYLQKLAANLAQKVKFSGREVQFASLTATERRIIHLYLKDHPDVLTVSEGEGNFRHLIIKPKTQ